MSLNLADFDVDVHIVEVRLHSLEDRSDNTTNHPTLGRLLCALFREILLNLMSKTRDRQSLEPHTTGTGQCRKKNSISTKDHIFDSRHTLNLKRNTPLESTHMTRMHAKRLARSEILHNHLTRQLQPGNPLSRNLLQ